MKEFPLCPQLPTLGVLFEATPTPVVGTTSTTWLKSLSQAFLAIAAQSTPDIDQSQEQL
jgi:hypothetical protein